VVQDAGGRRPASDGRTPFNDLHEGVAAAVVASKGFKEGIDVATMSSTVRRRAARIQVLPLGGYEVDP